MRASGLTVHCSTNWATSHQMKFWYPRKESNLTSQSYQDCVLPLNYSGIWSGWWVTLSHPPDLQSDALLVCHTHINFLKIDYCNKFIISCNSDKVNCFCYLFSTALLLLPLFWKFNHYTITSEFVNYFLLLFSKYFLDASKNFFKSLQLIFVPL